MVIVDKVGNDGSCFKKHKKNPKVQSPTERPFRLRARNLVTMSVANERGVVKGESSWILVEHVSSKHLEVIQS